MKKNIVLSVILAILIAWMVTPVFASGYEDAHEFDCEDTADESEQVYTWIQEGDAVFCYQNTGGWQTEDMLKGFHTIGDYVYYFSERETDEWRYGQMVTGRVEIYGGTYTFDSAGHMTSCYGGLE